MSEQTPVELHNWSGPARDLRSSSTAKAVVGREEPSAGICFPEFTTDIFSRREINAPTAFIWLAIHLVSFFCALRLYFEIDTNLQYHDRLIQQHCGQAEHLSYGVCVSDAWKLAFYDEFPLQHHGARDFTFTFQTTSTPPTFILVVVPEGPNGPKFHERYSVRITRSGGSQGPPETFYRPRNYGVHSIMVLDESTESAAQLSEPIKWDGLIVDTTRSVGYGDDSTFEAPRERLRIFVEDADIPHLEMVRSHPVCSVPKAWHALSDHAVGEEHFHLAASRYLVGVSCWITLISCVLVWRWFGGASTENVRGASTSFAWLVGLKSVLHDLPLQVGILLYLYRWYDAGGERCQLCLLDPTHCDTAEHPWHFTNMVLTSTVNNP
ncbi:hypothetical protein FOL46_005104 [Perkinsus olseni]|uniref:Uncharacterized protein n=1 Tax=Perkinsus olseni TaxID=32597 RepID=A0A7J6LUA7_PEROL|nr:hypothetical protein FOL46_005104 [Perkinsus olseni]